MEVQHHRSPVQASFTREGGSDPGGCVSRSFGIYDAVRAPGRDIVKTLVTLTPYTAGFAGLHQLATLLEK